MIQEWDIAKGNVSIMKEFNMLKDTKKLEWISNLPKDKRNVYVGDKLLKTGEISAKELENNFDIMVKKFIELNGLDPDYDIISIKRDAVFVVNKEIRFPQMSENVVFRPKMTAHAFILLNGIELYFSDDDVEIKGLSKNIDDIKALHKEGMLRFLRDVVEIVESHPDNPRDLYKYLHEYISAYKRKELTFDNYREFNPQSKYVCSIDGSFLSSDEMDDDLFEFIDISYNYKNIIKSIVPLLLR